MTCYAFTCGVFAGCSVDCLATRDYIAGSVMAGLALAHLVAWLDLRGIDRAERRAALALARKLGEADAWERGCR